MNRILFFIMIFFCTSSNAQVKKSIDKISGDTTWFSAFEKLYSKASFSGTVGEQLKVVVSRDKKGYQMGVWLQTAKSLSYTINEGDTMRIKCKDETVINLPVIGNGAETISDNLTGSTSITLFKLDNVNLKLLLEKEIVFIRIEGSPGYLEYDIKDKFQSVVSKCIKSIVK